MIYSLLTVRNANAEVIVEQYLHPIQKTDFNFMRDLLAEKNR